MIDHVVGVVFGQSLDLVVERKQFPRFGAVHFNGFSFARDLDGTPMLVLDRVMTQKGTPLVVAHVARRLDIIERETKRARLILVLAAVVACVAVVIASFFIARSATEPIVRLTTAMAELLDRLVSSVQPRFSELRAAGKIAPSGERRRNPTSNKRAHVWRLA